MVVLGPCAQRIVNVGRLRYQAYAASRYPKSIPSRSLDGGCCTLGEFYCARVVREHQHRVLSPPPLGIVVPPPRLPVLSPFVVGYLCLVSCRVSPLPSVLFRRHDKWVGTKVCGRPLADIALGTDPRAG